MRQGCISAILLAAALVAAPTAAAFPYDYKGSAPSDLEQGNPGRPATGRR